MRKFRNVSLESIAFQNDSFGSDIESIIYKLKKLVDVNPSLKHDVDFLESSGTDLEKLIYSRLGLRVNLIINTYCPGAMIVFPINRNHILLKDYWRDNYHIEDQAKLTKDLVGKKGTVDLKNAKLGGIFSEYKHTMYCDIIGNLDAGMTVPSVVAIILHELGHAFTYYEFSDRVSSTNQVMADIALTVKDKADKSKRIYLFKELATKLDIDEKEFNDILEEDNRIIFGVKLFKKYMTSVSSLMEQVKYDETSSEQLADNFATRFGYGKHIVEALDVMMKGSAERSRGMYKVSVMLDLLVTLLMPLVAIAGMVLFIPLGVFYSFLLFIILTNSGDNDKDMTYDDLKTRYSRVRHQLILQTQELNISKSDLKALVDSIHQLDDIIKGTQVFTPLYTSIVNFFSSTNKSAKENIALQKVMETLTNNELFVKSAQLRTL